MAQFLNTRITGSLHISGSSDSKISSRLEINTGDLGTRRVAMFDNSNEGVLTLSNGANWGFIARGAGNNPYIGAWHSGSLHVVGFSNSDGSTIGHTLTTFDLANRRVGIGTTSPVEPLDVAGTARFDNSITEGTHFVGTSLAHWGDGDTNISFTDDQIVLNAGNVEFIRLSEGLTDQLIINEGGAALDLRVEGDADTNLIRTDAANDRVGIGTSTPQRKLDVKLPNTSGDLASIAGQISVGVYQGIHFGYAEAGNNLYRKSAIVFERTDFTSNNAQGKVHILNGPQAGSGNATLADAKFTIGESGNVGIGETSPSHSLHVVGTYDVVKIEGSGSANSSSLFEVHGNNGLLFAIDDDLSDSLFSVNTIAGLPVIEAFADNRVVMGAFNQNDLVISGSRVGIGTDTPAGALDIYGKTGNKLQIAYFTDQGADDPTLRMFYGKATRPGYSFTSDNTSGMFSSAAGGFVAFAASQTERFRIDSDVKVQGATDFNITGTSRRLNFSSGTGTIRTTTANALYLATNSTIAVAIDSNQNTGIGTTTIGSKLHVSQSGNGAYNTLIVEDADRKLKIGRDQISAYTKGDVATQLYINAGSTISMNASAGGTVIGATGLPSNAKLAVVGNISGSGDLYLDGKAIATSFTGSFKGDGSGLQNVTATINLAQVLGTGNDGGGADIENVGAINATSLVTTAGIDAVGAVSASNFNLPRGGRVTFYGNNSGDHSISGTDANGNGSDDIRINSYHNVYVNLDSNNNNTSDTTSFEISQHGGTGTLGTSFFKVQGDGKVGIGTTSPSQALDVNGTIRATGSIFNAQTFDATNSTFNSTNTTINSTNIVVGNNTTDFVYVGGSTLNVYNGKVGIGNSAPSGTFHVTGESYFEGGARDWNETTPGISRGSIHIDPGAATDHYGGAITFGASDSGNGTSAQGGIYTRTDGSYGTKMYFATTDQYSAGSKTRMFIGHDGKVGIGTTSPTSELHIYDTTQHNATYTASLYVQAYGSVDQNGRDHVGGLFHSKVNGSSNVYGYGVIGIADKNGSFASRMIGVQGIGRISGTNQYGGVIDIVGVEGKVDTIESNTAYRANRTYGLYSTLNALSGSTIEAHYGLYVHTGNRQAGSTITSSYAIVTELNAGNVGIGTTSPDYTLDVNGNVGMNDYIYHNGDSDTYFGFNAADSFKIRLGNGDRTVMTTTSTTFNTDTTSTGYLQSYGLFYHRNNIVVLNKAGNGWVTWATRDTTGADSKIDLTNIGRFNSAGNAEIGGNLTVAGIVTAQEFHTEFVSASIVFTSGSTKFGDTSDDRHHFTGRVGVNVSDPQAPLEVMGTSATPADGNEVISITNTTGGTKLLLGVAENSYGWVQAAEGSTMRNLLLNPNGGNVGIGTTSPAYKLTTAGTVFISGSTFGNPNTEGAYKLKFWDNGGTYNDTGIGVDGSENGAEKMWFNALYGFYFNYGTGGQRITFDQDGKVGVGTSRPAAMLDITGSSASDGRRFAVHGGTYGHSLEIIDRSGYTTSTPNIYIQDADNNGARATLRITGNGGAIESMFVASNGYTGLGTTTPGEKLHVVGNMRLEGILEANEKSFNIEHPTKPGKRLIYGVLEGPEHGVYVRGTGTTNIIELPEVWTGLVHQDTITVQLTCKGKPYQIWVEDIRDNKVYINTDVEEFEFYYYVQGERKDVAKLITERDAN